MTRRYLVLCLLAVLALGSRAHAQIDLNAIKRGVQGCPDLTADASLGGLAAALCRPQSRTTLDLPVTIFSTTQIQSHAGSFSLLQRQPLLALAQERLGPATFNQLNSLLLSGTVITRSQDSLRRWLIVDAGLPGTPPAVAASLLAQANALVAGKFEQSIPQLLATRIDRDRLADLRAGRFSTTAGVNAVDTFALGLVRPVMGNIGGAPSVVDDDGNPVYEAGLLALIGYPFFVGPDGVANSTDDLPYVTNNLAAQAAGFSLSPPISGTPQDRFDATNNFPTVVPVYSATAKITVPSLANPGVQKMIEVYGVLNPVFLTRNACRSTVSSGGLGGTFDDGLQVCTVGAQDVTAQAQQIGCSTYALQVQSGVPGVGKNLDGQCIELNSGPNNVITAQVQAEVIPQLANPALRPAQAAIEPTDLTDLRLRSAPKPARPVSANGTPLFPAPAGGVRRLVDPVTGAPVGSAGGSCSVRLNGSSVPIGPNGIAGDGDDMFPSSGNCLLWGPPNGSGVQQLASPGRGRCESLGESDVVS